jgi:hypothetical protein
VTKILRAPYFSIFGIFFSILIFNQLAIASPFPGDEAIVAGNMTLDLALSQPPVETNESITTNSSIVGNNTNQTNQTILMTMNKT